MYIIIIGGGGVGYELARNLSENNQDVVVIEKNSDQARRLSENLDIMVIEGNGASAEILDKAEIKNADILIAVTEIDEINIISCMLAKRFGVPVTVGRVRDADYLHDSAVLSQEQIGIDIVINPERAAASEISKILHFPEVSDIEYFYQGKVMMLGLTVGEETDIVGKPLSRLSFPPGCIVVGINSPQGGFIIPAGKDSIQPGDKVYIAGSTEVLRDISWLLHHEKTRIRRVAIMGGGMIGLQLAQLLESSRNPFSIVLMEKDQERCRELSQELSRTLVLKGDVTDLAFLEEEEIQQADAVVAVTGDDRTNILMAALSRQRGIKKIISEVKDPQYMPVYHTLGIDSVVNPRLVAASQILSLTKREEIISLSILEDERAEIVELILPESARVTGCKVSEAHFPRGLLIGSIVREGKVIVPHGETRLLPEDHLVIFMLPEVSQLLDRYFAGSRNGKVRQNHKRAQKLNQKSTY
ncbi:MAG TPA: Trk system potassium transporter TrkA [Firmicutes bacterium]|nr:Trk system potassium transporter TrkA [Bacillota bacterium]